MPLADLLAILMVVAVIAALMIGYPVALTLAGVSLAFAVLAAAGGRRKGGVRTEFERAVYSPCPLCPDSDAPPLWQITARKVTHDQQTHDITYRDAFFELAGVPLTIACDKLIRVDFAAAGSVLNWAAEQQAQGHVVQFHNLQRLVAIFFNVIGINEHAWVVPRKN